MVDSQQGSNRLEELSRLLVSSPETSLDLYNLNTRLAELFGRIDTVVRKPEVSIAMPFVEKYTTAVYAMKPAVEHSAFLRPEMNSKVRNNIALLSPFSVENRRMPLLGVSFQPDVIEPFSFDESFVYLEVKPVPNADTVISVISLRRDLVRNGSLLVELSMI